MARAMKRDPGPIDWPHWLKAFRRMPASAIVAVVRFIVRDCRDMATGELAGHD